MPQHDSYVGFRVDGDASGGEYFFMPIIISGGPFDEERRLLVNQHAQSYHILGDIVGGGPHVCLSPQSLYGDEDWFNLPPYGGGRWGFFRRASHVFGDGILRDTL